MPRISLDLTEQEDLSLERHCEKHQRTKREVLRQYVQSLTPAEQELPIGWYNNDGKIGGEYRGYRVILLPREEGFEGYAVNMRTGKYLMFHTNTTLEIALWIPTLNTAHSELANVSHAVEKIETAIDNELD